MEINHEIILDIKDVDKIFSTVKVLSDVNLTLKKSEILAIVGENGAGKSTLMNILGGIIKKDKGEIYYEGKRYEPNNPLEAQNAGIAFIHQELNLFTNLSVAENMFIEDLPKSKVLRSVNYKYMRETAKKYLDMLQADINVNSIIEKLPMGHRQMVEIAKAISKNAKILIFDEPTTSLSNTEKMNLFRVINELKERGTSIIYISHILSEVFQLCDRVSVLRDGKVVGTAPISSLTKNEVIKMMVGRELNNQYPTAEKAIGEKIFEVKNICQDKKVKNVSFSLNAGEIVGMFGLMGAGRTELVKAIFGVDKIDSGEVLFRNESIAPITPSNLIKKGVALITEDRRYEGLLMPKTVKENIALTILPALKGKLGIIDGKKENELSEKTVRRINIKTYDMNEQIVQKLSGGNQQKVVLGKWFLVDPKVIILDEPTRGVDVGAKYEIYTIINDFAKNGSAVLVISSEMEELIGICDKIMVLAAGKITAVIEKDEFAQETILRAAIGGEHQ